MNGASAARTNRIESEPAAKEQHHKGTTISTPEKSKPPTSESGADIQPEEAQE